MNNILEKYKLYLKDKKLSENTINSYLYDVNCFMIYIENEYQEQYNSVKRTHVLTYLVNIQKKGKSSSSISRNICSIKKFFEYLLENKLITENPIINIHSPKHVKKLPVIISEEEIDKLLQLPDKSNFKGSRDAAILELLYSSGIKVTELINIKIDDIAFFASIIHVNNKIHRIVPIGTHAMSAINNYLDNFRDNKVKENCEYLFINNAGEALTRQGIWKILKYYEKKLGLKKELSPQVLRNSFAVHMLNHGANIVSVQELLGQKNLTAMQNYINLTNSKSLETFKNAHPRA